MTAAICKSRIEASRCSRRRSLRYFSGGTRTSEEKARAAGRPVRFSVSWMRAVKGASGGFPLTVARWRASRTWSRTLSPSPPNHPWSVVKWGLYAPPSVCLTVER